MTAASGFGPENLPFGVARPRSGGGPARVVTRLGDRVVPVGDIRHDVPAEVFEEPSLNRFLALGSDAWAATRAALTAFADDPDRTRDMPHVDEVELLLPVAVGDYVDFYSSLHHATNLGRLFRPDGDPLLPNWRRLPVGYHGRAGTMVVSGRPVRRPTGLVTADGDVRRLPSRALDFELEVGFVVGGPGNRPDEPVAPDEADRHVFGVVLVDDWSARDIQAFEYQPLGPFLSKSFATTMSAWVVPLAAVRDHLVDGPVQEPPPDERLGATRPWGLDLVLEVSITPAGAPPTTVTRTNFRHLYWTFAQQLAHMTSNGATIRPGDLFASGTVSGPTPSEYGSLIELTARGERPVTLADGSSRTYLEDGDTVTIRGWCEGEGYTISLGDATGTVLPAPPS